MRVCLLVGMSLLLLAAVAVPQDGGDDGMEGKQSSFVDDAVEAMSGLDAKVKEAVDAYAAAGKEGTLFALVEDEGERRWFLILKGMEEVIGPLFENYRNALDEGTFTGEEPVMGKIRDAYRKARAEFEKCGYWYPCQIDEKPFEEESSLQRVRRDAFRAMLDAKGGGAVEAVKEGFAAANEEVKGLAEQYPAHPYVERTAKEIARIEAECAKDVEGTAAKAAAAVEQAAADMKKITAIYAGNKDALRLVLGYLPPSTSDWEKFVNDFEVLAATIPELKPAIDEFCARYGSTENGYDIDRKLKGLLGDKYDELKGDLSPGLAAKAIFDAVTKLDANRRKLAADIVGNVKDNLGMLKSSYSEEFYWMGYDEAARMLRLAQRLDPESAEVKALQEKVAADSVASAAAVEKAIDARKWPGHMEGFEGPGTVEEIAASAMEYFRESKIFTDKAVDPGAPLLVAVRSNYFVHRTDIFGFCIEWGVELTVAFVKDKEKNLADCFDISLLTKREAGVGKGPPWEGIVVGGPWQMRLSNLPLPK